MSLLFIDFETRRRLRARGLARLNEDVPISVSPKAAFLEAA